GLHVIAYRATLDVPRELVRYLSRLLAAERRARGTRKGTRKLTCWYQALMVLVWFRKGEDKTLLGAGFGVSRATAYRYVAEGIAVLTAQAPDLREALQRVAADGWSHVILDGKLFATDRLAETTTSVKGEQIHAWYSGKHRDFGANIQALWAGPHGERGQLPAADQEPGGGGVGVEMGQVVLVQLGQRVL